MAGPDAEKLPSPEYVAVMVLVPPGNCTGKFSVYPLLLSENVPLFGAPWLTPATLSANVIVPLGHAGGLHGTLSEPVAFVTSDRKM